MNDLLFPADVQKRIDNRRDTAFLFDFDGTLVHFAPHPDDVIMPNETMEHVRLIAGRSDISFAFVTGRSIRKLDNFLGGVLPTVVGCQGAEWRANAGDHIHPLAAAIPAPARRALELVAEKHDCIFEDKFYTVSMHLPYAHMHKDLVPELAAATAEYPGAYVIRRVNRTYEVLQKDVNKGSGIRYLMAQPGFAGKVPLYVGDDVDTDTSLDIVNKMGGVCLFVSNAAAIDVPHDKTFMGIDAARSILEILARPDPQ
jgi:trehalose 6-phosphate phosphatase